MSKDVYINQFESFREGLLKWLPLTKCASSKAKVVDFFCGCGGTSLGFASCSNFYDVVLGVDINAKALESFNANFACPTLHKDIRTFNDRDIQLLHNIIGPRDRFPLIFIGCAPCQGFSAHRKKDGQKPEDNRNSLINVFVEIALKFQPDYIVMENVKEVITGKYKVHYQEALNTLLANGYNINKKIYNAAGFGVPQARVRAIIVASKKSIELPEEIYTPDQYSTVRDAFKSLPKANLNDGPDKYHYSSKHRQSTIDIIKAVPKNGGSRPANVGPACLDRVKGFSDVYGRLYWDKPAVTITKTARNPACGRFSHPEEDRGLTLREVARLQSFPDGFLFCGGSSDRYEQVGEAVPPLLSMAIATQIYLNEIQQ